MTAYAFTPTCPVDDTLLVVQAEARYMVHELRAVMVCPECRREYVLSARLSLVEESARRTAPKLAQLAQARAVKAVAA